jgi:hypothetical protein
MNMMRPILVACLILAGCASPDVSAVPKVNDPTMWQLRDVVGRTLVTRGDDCESYTRFDSDGFAYVTILQDGLPPVAPLMCWSIDDEGALLVSQSEDMTNAIRHEIVSRDDGAFTVKVNEKTIVMAYKNNDD